jgi:4-hydroxyphenylpyruvate dioxygenase-like putative hemolysin
MGFLFQTQIKKEIIKFIEDKFSFPYLYYDKAEQTWYNEFFLYDIKTQTIFVSDEVKVKLYKRFGKEFIEKVFFEIISDWFKISHKYPVSEVI